MVGNALTIYFSQCPLSKWRFSYSWRMFFFCWDSSNTLRISERNTVCKCVLHVFYRCSNDFWYGNGGLKDFLDFKIYIISISTAADANVALKIPEKDQLLDARWFRKGLVTWNFLLIYFSTWSSGKWHFRIFLTKVFWWDLLKVLNNLTKIMKTHLKLLFMTSILPERLPANWNQPEIHPGSSS